MDLPHVVIRDAAPDDWPAIYAVVEPIVRAGDTYTWDADSPEHAIREKWLHTDGPGRTFVAVVDGVIAGTAEIHPNYGGGAAAVANAAFMVASSFRGRGIARALAEHVLTTARQDGYHAMVFNAVVETNTGAVRLWQSLGFTIIGTIPAVFRLPGGDLVGLHVMHRSLLP